MRYPPSNPGTLKVDNWDWPVVNSTAWCGEFQWNRECARAKWDEILG